MIRFLMMKFSMFRLRVKNRIRVLNLLVFDFFVRFYMMKVMNRISMVIRLVIIYFLNSLGFIGNFWIFK